MSKIDLAGDDFYFDGYPAGMITSTLPATVRDDLEEFLLEACLPDDCDPAQVGVAGVLISEQDKPFAEAFLEQVDAICQEVKGKSGLIQYSNLKKRLQALKDDMKEKPL